MKWKDGALKRKCETIHYVSDLATIGITFFCKILNVIEEYDRIISDIITQALEIDQR